jgi:hypothetical protein
MGLKFESDKSIFGGKHIMMDITPVETGATLFALSKVLDSELVKKILGPTCDYIGIGAKQFVEKRANNIKKIFNKAYKKLNKDIEGSVSPKILKVILDEGSFCEDELSAEYFGGILASSKSTVSRDDRGIVLISLISRMSTYQMRTHYILYHYCKNKNNGIPYHFGTERQHFWVFIPFNAFLPLMEFDDKENVDIIIEHSLAGLVNNGLLDNRTSWGKEIIEKQIPDLKLHEPGIFFVPTFLGLELFLWGYGRSDLKVEDFFNSNNKFEDYINIIPTIK